MVKEYKNILIKDAKIIDIKEDKQYIASIYIIGSVIEELFKESKNIPENILEDKDTFIIQGQGLLVTQGLLDMHAHLREPGDEDSEDIESGIISALRGGIIGAAAMPNTDPVIDSPYLVDYIIKKAAIYGFDIYPVAAITKGSKGKELAEFGLLKEAGACALSDDGKCVKDSRLMFEALRYAKSFSLPMILHEEDNGFSGSGLMHEGVFSTKLGLEGISALSEELIILRDVYLAKKAKAPIHITHVSTRGSVEIIKRAKEEGLDITCDVTPHHIFFNDSFLEDYNTDLKVMPPIRSDQDQAAIIKGIIDGVIDCIASDHAPHKAIKKDTTFKDAAFGAIGFETLFKASYTKLCIENNIGLKKVLQMLTTRPASILNIGIDKIEKGVRPSIVVFDLSAKGKYDKKDIFSKSKNSPFQGFELHSEIVATINRGRLSFINVKYGDK